MRRTFACALLLLVAGGAAAQERQIWTVTCTKAGRTVYRERIADRPSQVKELEVGRLNPGAVCIVLAPEEAGGVPADLAAALQQSRPGATLGPVLSFASPAALPQDAGIDAALRALKGDGLPVAPRLPAASMATQPGAEPERLGVEILTPPETTPADARPGASDWVRLALYKDASEDDAVADWARIVSAAPSMGAYTPNLAPAGEGYLMLAVGPVRPREAAPLCLEAAALGLDCIPGSGPPSVPGPAPVLDALARSYPGLVAWGASEPISRPPEAGWDGDGPACPSGGPVGPRRPWVDLTALGTGAPAPPAHMPKERVSSSSGASASSLATSSSTRPKARPATAFNR